jgi:hypothetical protein
MMTAIGPLSLNAIQIDAAEPLVLAHFWSELVGVPVVPGSNENSASLMASNRIPPLVFERTDEPKIWRNRITFRFITEDFDAHLSRLLEMSVPFVRTDRGAGGERAVEFLDPESNEFAITERRRLP